VLALARAAGEPELVTPGERYSVEDRAIEIEEQLRLRPRLAFSTLLLEHPTLRFAIVTFLAILDLFRRGVIDLEQEALFDDITVLRRGGTASDG
jgi:segregation and condensation protein A